MKVVYGANCTWWDTINKVGKTPGPVSLPACPHCGSVLFEVESEERWLAGAKTYEDNGNPGYVEELNWHRGKCFPNWGKAHEAYLATGEA